MFIVFRVDSDPVEQRGSCVRSSCSNVVMNYSAGTVTFYIAFYSLSHSCGAVMLRFVPCRRAIDKL